MTHSDPSHRDDAERLNEALDALVRGDHSSLDALPPEEAETVSRLFWLAQQSSNDVETARSHDVLSAPSREIPDAPIQTTQAGIDRAQMPISERTRRSSGSKPLSPRTEETQAMLPQRQLRLGPALRVAAVLAVLLLMGGAAFGLFALLGEPDPSQTGSDPTQATHPQQLQPGLCSADIQPLTREAALSILRDVDADRDETLRRSIVWEPVELGDGEVQRFADLFVRWQSCRRFGSTYQAMTLQAPYFTREDFYGESTLGFRGPIETAYSDATLNEMLDRREDTDVTSRQYWENAGTFPGMEDTLTLGGEAFATEDGQFIAIRVLTWQMSTNEWQPSTTVVIYQWSNEEYLLFDIVSTPQGMAPYVYGAP